MLEVIRIKNKILNWRKKYSVFKNYKKNRGFMNTYEMPARQGYCRALFILRF
jgi:hypothetical protein